MRAEGQSEGGNGERDTELLGYRIYLRIGRRSNSQRRLLIDSESGHGWSRDFFYRAGILHQVPFIAIVGKEFHPGYFRQGCPHMVTAQ
jgi:hypothetical protein